MYSDVEYAITISVLARNGQLSDIINGLIEDTSDFTEEDINNLLTQDNRRLLKASEVYCNGN